MTERPAFDPADVTPQRFAQLVTGARDDDILRAIRGVGTQAVLDRVFDGMQEAFLAEKAGNTEARVRFVITDAGQEHAYTATIGGSECSIDRTSTEPARFTMKTDLASFCRLLAGCANRPLLLLRGRLKVSGDLVLGLRVESFFEHIRT